VSSFAHVTESPAWTWTIWGVNSGCPVRIETFFVAAAPGQLDKTTMLVASRRKARRFIVGKAYMATQSALARGRSSSPD
jgi:hypothetical protein